MARKIRPLVTPVKEKLFPLHAFSLIFFFNFENQDRKLITSYLTNNNVKGCICYSRLVRVNVWLYKLGSRNF